MAARIALTLGLLLLVPLAAAAPEQVRLGFTTTDPSAELVVSWFEQTPNLDPRVTLTGPDGEARVFAATRVDGPTAGFVYEARLTGLAPGADHTYDIGGRSFGFRRPARTARSPSPRLATWACATRAPRPWTRSRPSRPTSSSTPATSATAKATRPRGTHGSP